ncbi:hypothetical protein N8987_07090 [Crocinitomix sp.]|nr:hypothetical protein [Crocinitomix sp.]
MKQFYSLCLSIFLMNAIAIGQGDSPSNYLTQYDSTRIKKMRPLGQDRAADDIVWEDGFDDAGVWTAAGPSCDYEVSGWSIGSTTNGWYFGTDDDMSTEGNFARFINGDPSEEPDPIEDGPFTLTYALPIDLTGIPAPHVEFEQYGARFYTSRDTN